ncbi:MAG TPA: SDR family NAD(P)-dependent oxidoreductase [Bryobacteraceae bacterium]|jgi:NAD(P)-dependent dehydrogenase (short-subunit alcohol dehydrogenase family)
MGTKQKIVIVTGASQGIGAGVVRTFLDRGYNVVAPGTVDTPLHKNNPKDFLKSLSLMGTISDVSDIVDAVVYLTEARQSTGEVLHVDGGAHSGKW